MEFSDTSYDKLDFFAEIIIVMQLHKKKTTFRNIRIDNI